MSPAGVAESLATPRGEMALLEGGRWTATLRAVTACRVAVVPSDRVDRRRLQQLAEGREQESHGEGTSR